MLIKYQLIFISVVLIVAEVRSEECKDNNCLDNKRPLGERKCKPGSVWKEDCNTCFCTETGQVGCTLMHCGPLSSQQIRVKRNKGSKAFAEKKCTPGETWKEDCNTCFCSSTGQIGCTLMACHHHSQLPTKVKRSKRDLGDEEQSEVTLQEETGKNCEIGTTVKLDCNICHCTAMGLACTRRLCHGQELSITVEE